MSKGYYACGCIEKHTGPRTSLFIKRCPEHSGSGLLPVFTRTADDRIAELEAELTTLRNGLRKLIAEGYDPIPKAEQCSHGQYGYQDCIGCYDDALQALLEQDT